MSVVRESCGMLNQNNELEEAKRVIELNACEEEGSEDGWASLWAKLNVTLMWGMMLIPPGLSCEGCKKQLLSRVVTLFGEFCN